MFNTDILITAFLVIASDAAIIKNNLMNIDKSAKSSIFIVDGIEYPDPLLECNGRNYGDLVPYPYICEGFVQCTNSGYEYHTCEDDLQFDASISVCNYKHIVQCVPLPIPPKKTCTELLVGDSYNHPTDCGKYIVCDVNSVAVERDCPTNLHYNAELKVCDWPQDANCRI